VLSGSLPLKNSNKSIRRVGAILGCTLKKDSYDVYHPKKASKMLFVCKMDDFKSELFSNVGNHFFLKCVYKLRGTVLCEELLL